MVKIEKDVSGKTYQYEMFYKGESVQMGDDWESVGEILDYIKSLLDSLSSFVNQMQLDFMIIGKKKTFIYRKDVYIEGDKAVLKSVLEEVKE